MAFFRSNDPRCSSPFQELQRAQDQMNQLFGGLTRSKESPSVNVWTGEDSIRLVAEVPGYAAEDLDLAVVGRRLTLSGRRASEAPEAEDEASEDVREESPRPDFTRSFRLPFEIDLDSVEATCSHGLFEVTLPRATENVRRIEVKNS